MSVFSSLIWVNGEPVWGECVPITLQLRAIQALELAGGYNSQNEVELWAKLANELVRLSIEKNNHHSQKGEASEISIADTGFMPLIQETTSLDNYICNIKVSKKIQAEMQMYLSDDECINAKILSGRALVLFDMAAIEWESENFGMFQVVLCAAEDASSSSRHYASWKMGQFYAEQDHSALAKMGGLARAERYQPLKEHAYKLVNARNYKSRRNAAQSIMQEILELSKTLSINLSEAQAEITISGWLAEACLPANRVR